jgi:uncharacterized protein YukE
MTIGLTYGEPSTAAHTLIESIGPLQQTLTATAERVETVAPGFSGAAAVGLVEALTAWFESAGTLGPVLQEYSEALVAIDATHATNDVVQHQTYSELHNRLGGPR